jgi:hypothetical protein
MGGTSRRWVTAKAAARLAGKATSPVPQFSLERRHRYRDLTQVGSFGPGVFSQYDTKVHIYRVNNLYQMDWFSPGETSPKRMLGNPQDGVFLDHYNRSISSAQLLDANGAAVASLEAEPVCVAG